MPDASGGIYLPQDDQKKLLARSLELIESCNSSQGIRAAYARQIYAVSQTGRTDGTRAKFNELYGVLDSLASHLFSPTDLRFTIDFENFYPQDLEARAKVAARVLTRDWERSGTDMAFGQGVFESLRYGATFLKQWPQEEGTDKTVVYQKSLVMPWQLGVTNEQQNDLNKQDAICETMTLTLPEVWRRISHLPDAEKLFMRIKGNARKGMAGDEQNSFFHQVLSTSPLNTGVQSMMRPVPGGIVQLNNDPNYAIVGPQVNVELVKMYELWVRDREDWVTIQIIEPDVIVAPSQFFKPSNLLISGNTHSGLHPYTRICANDVHGYIWGRSELTDLIEPQALIATWADDITRIFGLQIDKILAFTGDGLTDEQYDAFRGAGYANLGDNGKVEDLTPQMPTDALALLQFAMQQIPALVGTDNILNGQGQPGVRSAEHGELLKQMASPRLRDRSLLIERQCAQAADLRLSIMEAKDARHYWTDGSSVEKMEATRFVLADLPDDRRVAVDSHSSSPVFRTEHSNLIAFGLKSGIVDGEYALDNLDFPNRDEAIRRLKDRQAQQNALVAYLAQKDPEGLEKVLASQHKKK